MNYKTLNIGDWLKEVELFKKCETQTYLLTFEKNNLLIKLLIAFNWRHVDLTN